MVTVELMAYTLDQASQATGLHKNTLRHLIDDGSLPALKLKRKILISRIELQKWLAGNNQPPAGTAPAN